MQRFKKLIILFFFTNAIVSFACQCPIISIKNSYKTSDIIIAVTVLSVLPHSNNQNYLPAEPIFGYARRVLITKTYKGQSLNDTITIEGEDSNCELYLEVGKSYLLFCGLKDNKIYTNKCTRSGLLHKHPDIEYLEKKLLRKK